MTRKDYELIARAMQHANPVRTRTGNELYRVQWEVTCGVLADALASANPRFDRERFLKACGV